MVKLTIRLDFYTEKYGLIRKETIFDYKTMHELDIEQARLIYGEIKRMKLKLDEKMGDLINQSNG